MIYILLFVVFVCFVCVAGPSLPLCVPISEIQGSTVKKHWRDRFTALEVTTKDGLTYIFAVERNNMDLSAEQLIITTMRRCPWVRYVT